MSIQFQDHSDVDLVEHMGSDEGVIHRARVSTAGRNAESVTLADNVVQGMINHMMKNRHGSVWEGAIFTFRVHTPIFVAREFMRHRTFGFNEESARYKQLDPVFYVPSETRFLRQTGKASAYTLIEGNADDYRGTKSGIEFVSKTAYLMYADLLEAGIAREVARMVLPVNIFTTFYATCNARNLMHFLSLRVDSEQNVVETHPLHEIQEVAEKMEEIFFEKMPETYKAFYSNGRVAP